MADEQFVTFLSGGAFGSYAVWGVGLNHGVAFTSREDTGRVNRAVYTTHVHRQDFTVDIAFPTYEAFNAFADWLERYAQALLDGGATAMQVTCPQRNFSQVGIPNGIARGDTSGTVVYRVSLGFSAASDPEDYFTAFANGEYSRYFYTDQSKFWAPGGMQLSAIDRIDKFLYDLAKPTETSFPKTDPLKPVTPAPMPGEDVGVGGSVGGEVNIRGGG